LDIDIIKSANRLEEIVAEDGLTVEGTGRYRRTREHDSLVLDTHGQYYAWNSHNETGDVIDWLQRRRGMDFRGAVELLCQRAGLEPPRWAEDNGAMAIARRQVEDALTVAARHFVRVLRSNEAAMAYARARGWTDETIRATGLGYWDGDGNALRGELRLHEVQMDSPAAKAVLSIPAGMLIYAHVWRGRVRYLSGRSIEGKRHHNLPRDLVGERQPYWNHCHDGAALVVGEGQADAITWGQWGVAAVALAGCAASVSLARLIAGAFPTIYLALDADQAGAGGTRGMAELLGPMCRVLPRWPQGNDANEALMAGVTPDDARALLANAPTWVELLAARAGMAHGADRELALREAFGMVRRMDPFQVSVMRRDLAKQIGVGLREFNELAKTLEEDEELPEDDMEHAGTAMIGGWIQEHLFESIYTPEEALSQLAVRYPDGRLAIVDELRLEGLTIQPISPFHPALKKSLLLPDNLGRYDNVKSLHREVRAFIHQYLDIDIFYENLAAYYVLLSWLYDSFQVLPYLRALGDYGTGKTRFLIVIGSLCFRPIFVAGATTTSPIFRMLHEFRGTLVLDEADFSNSDAESDIVKILNIGYARDFDVQRSGKRGDGSFEVEFYEVFGPKVIATRRKFADRALESRCLTREMGGALLREDIPIVLPLSFRNEARAMRNKLLRYRLEHWQQAIEVTNDDMDRTVEPRLNQVTIGLKKMVDDPTLVEEIDRFIREYQRQTIVERSMTLAAKTLQAIIELGNEPTGVGPDGGAIFDFTLKTIADRVNAILDAENEGDGGDDESDEVSKLKLEVKPKKIGHIVRNELGLRTERDHSNKSRYAIIWDGPRIRAIAGRYGLEEWLDQAGERVAGENVQASQDAFL